MGPPSTGAFDHAEEAAWEVAAVTRAIKRYREFADSPNRDPADLAPGRRVLAETVGPVSARVTTLLDEAATIVKGGVVEWHAPLSLFPADVLAFIAVSSALRAGPVEQSRVGTTLPAYAMRVCNVLRDQADHDRFLRDNRKAAKVDAEAAELLRRWTRCNPQADRRSWGRFSARLEGVRSARWGKPTCMLVGAVLVRALVEGAPEWFERDHVGLGPVAMRPLHILLTPYAVERMMEADARAEVARPMMMPMIIRPNPWKYQDERPNEAA